MGVYKKSGHWFIDYRLTDGRRKREKIGPSKALAEKVLAKRKVEIAENRYLDIERKKEFRFKEAAERFLEYSRANKRSFKRDHQIVHKYLLPCFDGKSLDAITSWDVERYKAARKLKVSVATVNRELACLKTIYNRAIEWKMTRENPVRSVKMFSEKDRARIRWLTREEMLRLIEISSSELRPIIIMALNTGMRKGEILNLTWNLVDLERSQLTVANSKNGRSRVIEINNYLLDTLKGLKKDPVSPYVFPGKEKNPLNESTVRKPFQAACKKAGIADFTFHDLRHTFASHLVMSGCDLKTVQELLGHRSIEMTMRYAHLSQAHKKKAVQTLSSILDGHFLDTKAQKVVNMQQGLATENLSKSNSSGWYAWQDSNLRPTD